MSQIFAGPVLLMTIADWFAAVSAGIDRPINYPRWALVPRNLAGNPIYLPRQPVFAAGGSSDYVNSWGDYRWNNFYDQSVIDPPKNDIFYQRFQDFLAGIWNPPPYTTTTPDPNATTAQEEESEGADSEVITSTALSTADAVETVNNAANTLLETADNVTVRPERAFLNFLSRELRRRAPSPNSPDTKLLNVLFGSLESLVKSRDENLREEPVASASSKNNALSAPDISSQRSTVEKPGKTAEKGGVFTRRKENLTTGLTKKRAEEKPALEIFAQPPNENGTIDRFDFIYPWGNLSLYPHQSFNNVVGNLSVPTGVGVFFNLLKALGHYSEGLARPPQSDAQSTASAVNGSLERALSSAAESNGEPVNDFTTVVPPTTVARAVTTLNPANLRNPLQMSSYQKPWYSSLTGGINFGYG